MQNPIEYLMQYLDICYLNPFIDFIDFFFILLFIFLLFAKKINLLYCRFCCCCFFVIYLLLCSLIPSHEFFLVLFHSISLRTNKAAISVERHLIQKTRHLAGWLYNISLLVSWVGFPGWGWDLWGVLLSQPSKFVYLNLFLVQGL